MCVIFLIQHKIVAFYLESEVMLIAVGYVTESLEMFIDKLVQLPAQIEKLLFSNFSLVFIRVG